MRITILLLLFCSVFISQKPTAAAEFTLTPRVVARFDDALNPLPFSAPANGPINDGPGIYQIDFQFEVRNLAANERGWANLGFDIMLIGALEDEAGWVRYPPLPEICSMNCHLPTFSANLDAGTPGDLQDILVSIPGGPLVPTDPRATFGQASPKHFGSIYVNWDGVTPSQVGTKEVRFGLSNHQGIFQPSQPAAGAVIQFQIPEPTTFVLAALAAIGLIGVGRRSR